MHAAAEAAAASSASNANAFEHIRAENTHQNAPTEHADTHCWVPDQFLLLLSPQRRRTTDDPERTHAGMR